MASQNTRASKRRRRRKAKLVPLSSQCEPVEKQLLCHASPKPNKVEMASEQARASKRQSRRRRKAKLSALLPRQPKPESVQLPSPPMLELVQLPNESEDDIEKQLLCHASPKPNKVEMASEQACASKRQRRRRRKAKLSALLPSQPKPESVPLPSPPMPELVQLPDESEESEEPEESEDDSSSDDEVVRVKPTERDLESDEAVWALYERWCLRHRKSRTPEEMQRRFNNFKKGAFHIFELNRKYFPCRFCMFRWTDETAEERKRRTTIPPSWDRT